MALFDLEVADDAQAGEVRDRFEFLAIFAEGSVFAEYLDLGLDGFDLFFPGEFVS